MLISLLVVTLLVTTIESKTNNVIKDEGVWRALYPPVVSLSSGADVTANATCGFSTPELFCRGQGASASNCAICDQRSSSDHTKYHGVETITDGKPNTWWQSPSLYHGSQYQYITVTIDLKQVYEITHVIVKCANSPRPASWILERSIDGQTFHPWRFFAPSEVECWDRYGLPATLVNSLSRRQRRGRHRRGRRKTKRSRGDHSVEEDEDDFDDEEQLIDHDSQVEIIADEEEDEPGTRILEDEEPVLCTTQFSKIQPMEGGEIHTSLVSVGGGTKWRLARFLRLRFQGMHNVASVSGEQARSLYYTIRDVSVAGRCNCRGHAAHCKLGDRNEVPVCECEHGTCGPQCDQCCPLFNQELWRTSIPCQACQCFGRAESCHFDGETAKHQLSLDTTGQRRGGGVCENCTDNTTGVNCELCNSGWFRPDAVDLASPCLRCPKECISGASGTTGQCHVVTENFGEVVCDCHDGYTGSRCERCAHGFRACDPRGSLPPAEEAINTNLTPNINSRLHCEIKCRCKQGTEGPKCDRCRSGHFHLAQGHPHGCLQCYCSGVSQHCKPASINYQNIDVLDDWLVTDLRVAHSATPLLDDDTGKWTIGNYELAAENYYWLAPKDFYSGNRLTSYGSNISFVLGWVSMRGDTSGKPTVAPDAILFGSNGVRLASGESAYNGRQASISIPLSEEYWYLLDEDLDDIPASPSPPLFKGPTATRALIMSVLADLKYLMLRGRFHIDQIEASLESVSWPIGDVSQNAGTGATGSGGAVEHCLCPPGYEGLSCESCSYGYVPVPSDDTPSRRKCHKCECNGHAKSCDPLTGQCSECQHNTTGVGCSECVVGFYGEPRRGLTTDCRPCACPLDSKESNYSPTCRLADNSPDDYICTACAPGHAGDKCERCGPGYFGSPLNGIGCTLCECRGGPCDPVSGRCLECPSNTEGWSCERCKSGFWGTPSNASCFACACDPLGSEGSTCNPETGQCSCLEHYTGRTCGECVPGHGNVTAGCPSCTCHGLGAASRDCNSKTGECTCLPGVDGENCEFCLENHYGLQASRGCLACGCHESGSHRASCDVVSGQCPCRPQTHGRTCDACQDGLWGIPGQCSSCGCDVVGAVSNACHSLSGQCPCKPGVAGRQCDRCLPTHYSFGPGGCSECEPCSLPGHICDPDTGRCSCPPLTTGAECDQCLDGTWGLRPLKGCKSCSCDGVGAVHDQCDPQTGRCVCRKGYEGEQCLQCASGYYGYPHCRKCECNLAGTKPEHCPDGPPCHCHQETGACPCKEHVEGGRCDRCQIGTFDLQFDNPAGCTQCFCFGRTSACSSAGLTRTQIVAPHPQAATLVVLESSSLTSQSNHPHRHHQHRMCHQVRIKDSSETLEHIHGLCVIPNNISSDVSFESTFEPDVPLYWSLPSLFLHDKVLSYGGYLRFHAVSESDNDTSTNSMVSNYPLVQLKGNGLVLEYYPLLPVANGLYQVRFHESLWRQPGDKEPEVSRELLMLALQKLEYIHLRVSDKPHFTHLSLDNVTMDTVMAAPGRPPPIAQGVELCDCPAEYNATSCQNPSRGYFRWHITPGPGIKYPGSTIVIQMVGEARPCQCNGRSDICDIESGHCLNCSDNTGGAHCEQCAPGYYGDPNSSCRPCPCPSIENNHAESCEVEPGPGRGHVLCRCQTGYTGPHCNRCSPGWYGPLNGVCSPCLCHAEGSLGHTCDEFSGQCICKPGLAGKDCSQCLAPRHILMGKHCATCDDGCTGPLLDTMDELERNLSQGAGHIQEGYVPLPWPQLSAIDKEIKNLSTYFDQWMNKRRRNLQRTFHEGEDLLKKHNNLEHKQKYMNNKLGIAQSKAVNLKSEADGLSNEIKKIDSEIKDLIDDLENYGNEESDKVSISAAVTEARDILHFIKLQNSKIKPYHLDARIQHEKAKRILNFIKKLLTKNPKIKHLQERFRKFENLLEDHLKILDNVTNSILQTSQMTKQNVALYNTTSQNVNQAKKLFEFMDESMEETQRLINDADNFLDKTYDNVDNFNDNEALLTNLTDLVINKVGRLSDPPLKERWVDPARRHAETMFQRAKQLKDQFNATMEDSEFAIRASKAYQNIEDRLKTAYGIANNANFNADKMQEHLQLQQKSFDSLANSSRVNNRAKNRLHFVEGMTTDAEKDFKNIKTLSTKMKQLDKTIKQTNTKLSNLDNNDVFDTVDEVLESSDGLLNKTANVRAKANNTLDQIAKHLRPNLELINSSIQRDKLDGMVTDAQSNIALTKNMLSEIEGSERSRQNQFSTKNNSISDRLQDLRNKILQARHLAEGIHVSVASPIGSGKHGCIRSFQREDLAPSTTNTIVLNYAIDTNEQDDLLLYIASNKTGDFMAVEMVERHIRFVWVLGGNVASITHPLAINSTWFSKKLNWYKIEVHRMASAATLQVKSQPFVSSDPHDGVIEHGELSSRHGTLQLSPHDLIWIGGLEGFRPKHLRSREHGLAGSLHQVVLDGRPIGLWNFVKETKCTATKQQAEPIQDDDSYRFNGDGYVILHQTPSGPYNKYIFSVSFKFRTLDEEALLFLAINPQKGHFVSLSLKNGKVLYQIGYGGDSYLEIVSSSRHNTGNWTLIEASRYFQRDKRIEKVILKVEGESSDGVPSSPPSEEHIPDLYGADFYIGGVPPNFRINSKNNIVLRSFLGCISDIQVMQESYNPFRGQFFGVERSCNDLPLKTVSFCGEGFLEVSSHPLKKKAEFSFVFRTLQDHAFLLLSALEPNSDLPAEQQNYYSASLMNGVIQIQMNAGQGEARLQSDTMLANLSDGGYHTVTVTRQARSLELRIDELMHSNTSLQDGSGPVLAAGQGGGLFIGGLPPGFEDSGRVAVTQPLVGTIKDVIMNGQLVRMDEAIIYHQAGIGHSSFSGCNLGFPWSEPTSSSKLGGSGHPASHSSGSSAKCKVDSYSIVPSAVKLGDFPHSHVQVTLPRRNTLNKNYTIELFFRTFYPDGLLFIVTGSRANKLKNHYISVSLQNKQVKIVIKARRKIEKFLSFNPNRELNDAGWHQIKLKRVDRILTLYVDKQKMDIKKYPKKLNVGNIMYIGGLPEAGLSLPDVLIHKMQRFKGCIRNLKINEQLQDLVGTKASPYRVTSCYPYVERGSYFPGDAYAIYEEKFHLGLQVELELELEFRTSQMTGVLISLSEPEGVPALSIEINNGKVIMSMDTGNGKPFYVEQGFSSEYGVCNNEWHRVKASFMNAELILKVDDEATTLGHPGNGHPLISEINSPLYIGGLPERASSGTLQTRDNFIGCLKKIVIKDQRRDWTDMYKLSNVLLNSCPVSSE